MELWPSVSRFSPVLKRGSQTEARLCAGRRWEQLQRSHTAWGCINCEWRLFQAAAESRFSPFFMSVVVSSYKRMLKVLIYCLAEWTAANMSPSLEMKECRWWKGTLEAGWSIHDETWLFSLFGCVYGIISFTSGVSWDSIQLLVKIVVWKYRTGCCSFLTNQC